MSPIINAIQKTSSTLPFSIHILKHKEVNVTLSTTYCMLCENKLNGTFHTVDKSVRLFCCEIDKVPHAVDSFRHRQINCKSILSRPLALLQDVQCKWMSYTSLLQATLGLWSWLAYDDQHQSLSWTVHAWQLRCPDPAPAWTFYTCTWQLNGYVFNGTFSTNRLYHALAC